MQASSRKLVECNHEFTEAISRLLKCYTGSPKLPLDVKLLCVNGGECTEILATTTSVARYAISLSSWFFTAGIHVARYCRGRLVPLLGLLHLLRGRLNSHYLVVNEVAEKLFLYGRDVFQESVVRVAVNHDCLRSGVPLVVVNIYGDPLGYARPSRRGRIIFENLLDVGWYLRSGV
jgi:60S ribosome subunit biogenesis protein NIP7